MAIWCESQKSRWSLFCIVLHVQVVTVQGITVQGVTVQGGHCSGGHCSALFCKAASWCLQNLPTTQPVHNTMELCSISVMLYAAVWRKDLATAGQEDPANAMMQPLQHVKQKSLPGQCHATFLSGAPLCTTPCLADLAKK